MSHRVDDLQLYCSVVLRSQSRPIGRMRQGGQPRECTEGAHRGGVGQVTGFGGRSLGVGSTVLAAEAGYSAGCAWR